MADINRSELRKIIMTILYQISVYDSNKIKYVKRIIHDEDLNKFYNFISNMMII